MHGCPALKNLLSSPLLLPSSLNLYQTNKPHQTTAFLLWDLAVDLRASSQRELARLTGRFVTKGNCFLQFSHWIYKFANPTAQDEPCPWQRPSYVGIFLLRLYHRGCECFLSIYLPALWGIDFREVFSIISVSDTSFQIDRHVRSRHGWKARFNGNGYAE